jgi:hypothetical protein
MRQRMMAALWIAFAAIAAAFVLVVRAGCSTPHSTSNEGGSRGSIYAPAVEGLGERQRAAELLNRRIESR